MKSKSEEILHLLEGNKKGEREQDIARVKTTGMLDRDIPDEAFLEFLHKEHGKFRLAIVSKDDGAKLVTKPSVSSPFGKSHYSNYQYAYVSQDEQRFFRGTVNKRGIWKAVHILNLKDENLKFVVFV